MVEAAEAERPDRYLRQSFRRDEFVHLQPSRLGESPRSEEADPLGSQPAKDEIQRSRGRRVQPLHVVNGDENGSFRSDLAEERSYGCGESPLVGYGLAGVGT